MDEDIQEIFNYLPIRKNQLENDYVEHLKETLECLVADENSAKSFCIMPLHLLFMFALQYKILRIYKENPEKYELALTIKNPQNGKEGILSPDSPTTIAHLGESEIVDLLKVIKLSKSEVGEIKKKIVRYRNDKIAHAKGFIETDVEGKINEYLTLLKKVQACTVQYNKDISDQWFTEIEEFDDMNQFFESRFLDSLMNPKDFSEIIPFFLESDKLTFEQWEQIVNKGLELAYDQTVFELKHVGATGTDQDRKENANRILYEQGEETSDLCPEEAQDLGLI